MAPSAADRRKKEIYTGGSSTLRWLQFTPKGFRESRILLPAPKSQDQAMPEAINGARYACQKCVNGHRTKTCQHWENEHDRLVRSLDISEVAPGASLDDIAVFAKTRSAGRPKAADLEKEKTGMTLYILLKTSVDGKESCKAVGEIDIDADGNTKETRKTCCSGGGKSTTSSPSNRSRTKSVSSGTTSKKRSLEPEISDISYETTRKNAKHECSCGSTCKCRFCPQHPNTKATQDVMRQVAAKVKEERKSKPDGQIEFHQTISDVVPCGGGQMTGANSQIFATDDLDQLELWRQQDDGTGNFLAEIPLDLSAFSPVTLESPQSLHFPTISSPLQHVNAFPEGLRKEDDFKLPLGHGSPSSFHQYLSLDGLTNAPTPASSSMASGPLNVPTQIQPNYPLAQPSFADSLKAGSCCSPPGQLAAQHAMSGNAITNSNIQAHDVQNLSTFGHFHGPGLIPFTNQTLMHHPSFIGQVHLGTPPVQPVQRSCCGTLAQQAQPMTSMQYGNVQGGPTTNAYIQHLPTTNVSQQPPFPGMITRHNSFPIYNVHTIPHISTGHNHNGPNHFSHPQLDQQPTYYGPDSEHINNLLWS